MMRRETLQDLEFDKLLNVISRFTNSDVSKRSVQKITPLDNRDDVEKRFRQVQEIRRLSQEGTPLKLFHFQDISQVLERVRPEGAVLEPNELLLFLPVLRIISGISLQMKDRFDLPLLKKLTSSLTGFPDILEAIERSIDSEGNILDSASGVLQHLRIRIRSLEGKIRKKLEEIIRDKKISPFLQDEFITKRAGRWVLPIRMDSKGQIPGVVHDVSRSGDTAFIEPLEIIGLANELENLVAEEKAEEIRILRSICEKIRRVSDDLESQYRTIVYLDMLNSIAKFSELLTMEIPQISDSAFIKLVDSRHPLLVLVQREGGISEAVPLDLSLGRDDTVMVITGPNAGGKTVAIKTVGLLLLMALSGIPVPADSSSTFPLVDELLVDIGDEQSIESSLSTFSAHVSKISEILQKADSKKIVLMDELGTGTEPVQGAAIACSVLKDLKEKGSLVFATTHLTDIVGFVHKTEGMVNASMEFDHKTLTPLYRLTVGEPGQSHALEIARRYGLPERIIDFARKLLGTIEAEFHSLIADLKKERIKYEEALKEVKRQRQETEEKRELLKEKLADAEIQRKNILQKAYEEAHAIIANTKRQVYAMLEESKKKKSREPIKVIEKTQKDINEKLKKLREEPLLSIEEIKEGEEVFVRSLGCDAKVAKIDEKHNRIWVKARSMDVEVPLSDISPKKGKLPELKKVAEKTVDEAEAVSLVLNIVGLRVDEALSKLERFLNHASLAGINEVTIVHGIGKGILLKAVAEHLTDHPLVKEFRSGEMAEGGRGVTLVTMK